MSNADNAARSIRPESLHEPDVQSMLAAIVESSDDAIYSKDANAVVTSWNRAAQELYGYTPEEAIGQDIAFLIPPAKKGEERAILARILAGEEVDHYDTLRQRKDGSTVEVSITASPVADRRGQIVGASVIARDISDRKRQEELEREIEKRDLIARAAHELKNPLTTIAGMADILRKNEEMLSNDDRQKAYGALIRQSERASRLINDLLELARIDSGQLQIDITTVDLHAVVAESIDATGFANDVAVSNNVAPRTMVEAEAFRLEEVFVNLFSNSGKYGATSIRVDASSRNGVVAVEIADDGPGIPDELRDVLFEPFTRGAGTGVPGSGLGLSIARRLCEAFGGDLVWDPEVPRGAKFVIKLLAA